MKRPRPLHPFVACLRAAVLAPLVSYLLIPAPLFGQVAPTATAAPGAGNTRVYVVPSGATVVDIATPNSAGLSHNRYTNYNVGAAGLVLNNAAPTEFSVASQLTGTLVSNFNLLPTAPAQVILNEVVAPNPSTLAGFTEITGTKADLVVANPYGITVNGAGFINTRDVTLAAAQPGLGADGRLSFLRSINGELLVTGQGLNAANVDYFTLLGRQVRIEGQVNAPDLTVVGGAADYDYAARAVSSIDANGSAPTYAIDSSLLGGMYTNRIRLIASEQGVGVRLLGDVAAAAGDFTIDASGRVQLSGRAYADQDLRVTSSAGVEVSGSETALTAKRDLTLAGGDGAMTLTDASLVAGRDLRIEGGSLADTSASAPADANRFAVGNVSIAVAGDATVSRSTYGAGAQLSLQAASVTLSDLASFYSGADSSAEARDLSMSATSGGFDAGNAQITSAADLALSSSSGLEIGASGTGTGVQAQGGVKLSAGSALDNAGSVLAGGSLTVRSNSSTGTVAITNSGRLQATEAVSIAARDPGEASGPTVSLANTATGIVAGRSVDVRGASLANAGAIQGTQGVTVSATGAVTTAAGSTLLTSGEAGRDIAIDAASFDSAGTVQSAGRVVLAIGGDAKNSGAILTLGADEGGAAEGIAIDARTLNNSGTLQSASTLDVTVTNGSTGIVNAGTLQSSGAMALTSGGSLTNATDARILGGGNVTVSSTGSSLAVNNAGRLQATSNITLGGAASPVALTQAATGVTRAGGSLLAPFSSLDNAGIVQTGNALALTATGAMNNRAGGTILTAGAAGRDITLEAASLANAGQIQATGALAIDVAGALENSGTLLTLAADAGGAARGITLAADTFDNTGRVQSAAGLDLAIANATASASNSGTISVADSFTLTVANHFTNTAAGSIIAGNDLSLQSGGAGGFEVTNAGRLQAGNNLVFGGSAQPVRLTNELNAVVMAGAALDLAAANVTNAGTMQAGGALDVSVSGALTNTTDGVLISTGGDVAISSNSLASAGTVQAGGALDLAATTRLENTGLIATSGTGGLSASAETFSNSGTISAGSTLALDASSSLSNSGALKAAGAIALTTPSLENTAAGSVIAGGDLVVKSGAGDFDVANAGILQSGADLSLGEVNATAALTHSAGGKILASNAAVLYTSAFENAGTVQGGTALTIASTGATNNAATGTMLTAGETPASLALAAETLTNAGTIQSNADLTLTTSDRLTNTSGAKLIGDGAVTLQSGAAGFEVSNSGTIQSSSALTIGTSSAAAALVNEAEGKLLSGAGLAVEASTIENAGVIQATGALTLHAATSLANESDASIVTTDAGSALSIDAGSVTNAGIAQSAGALTLGVSGALTNSGTLLTANAHALTATAGTIDNSGTLQSGGELVVTTTQAGGTTLANRGVISSAAAMTLTTPGTLENAAAGVIASGASLTLHAGATDFSVVNAGSLRAEQDLNLGTATSRVALTNSSTGSIGTGGALDLSSSTFANSGLIQSTGATTIDASGAVTNNAGARILVTGESPASLVVEGASLTNAGTLQSTGAITATTTGATINSGTILGTGTSAMELTAGTLENTGTVESGGTLALTATASTGTTVDNSGTLRSAGAMTLTAPGVFANSAADAKVISGGTLAINASVAGDVTNAGLLQSAGALTIGNATDRAALTNEAGASILSGDTLTARVTTASNAGAIQSAAALILDATGAVQNTSSDATLLTKNAGASVTLDAASLANAGTVQSGGAIAITTSGAATNSGTLLTTNDGTMSVTSASLTNSGAIKSEGALTTNLTGALTNTSAGKITGDAAVTLGFTGSAGSVDNAGVIQTAAGLEIGSSSARAGVTNSGTLLASSEANVVATTVANTGTIQAGATFAVDATGAITNTGSDAKMLAAGSNQSLTLEGASLDNSGIIQSSGAVSATTTASIANSGTIISASSGAIDLTAGSSLSNTGTIDSAGAATLAAGTTFTQGGAAVIATDGNLALVTGTAYTAAAGSSTVSGGTLALTGEAGFTATNSGVLQSAGALAIGTTDARAALVNNADAKILSGETLTVRSTTASNAGAIQSADELLLDATDAVQNTSSAATLLTTTAGATLTVNGASLTNAGIIQSGGAIATRTTGATTNSGTLLTTNGGTLDVTADSLTNSGAIKSEGALATQLTGALTNTSAGKITGDAAITLGFTGSAGTIDNAGVIQTAAGLEAGSSSARAGITNSGTLLATGAANIDATTLTNTSTLQSGDTLAVDATGAISSTGSDAKILNGGTDKALTLTGASLTNGGTIQSTGGLTATVAGAVSNSGTILTQSASSGTLNITAGTTFVNSGTIDSAADATLTAGTTLTQGSIVATDGDLTLKTGTAYTGGNGSSTVGGGTVTLTGNAGFTVSNSGVLQSAAAMTIGSTGARVALTNNVAGEIRAGNLTVHATDLTHAGLMQAADVTLTIGNGNTLTNQTGARILASGNLSVTTPGTGFTLTNYGTLQAGGTTTLGGAGQGVTLGQASGAKLITDALVVRAHAIDNSGAITTSGSTDITASSFYNRGSGSKLVAGATTGTTSLSVSGGFTNEGVVFAANALSISASGITISSTGGTSSLGNMTLSSTGDIANSGALYSAGALTASAGGTFQINESGTIDTGGNFNATAATFRNRGQIEIGGNGDIAATTFENVMTSQPASKVTVGPTAPAGPQGFTTPIRAYEAGSADENDTNKLTAYFIQNYGLSGIWDVSPWGYLLHLDSDIVWYATEQFRDANGNTIDTATLSAATKPQIAAANLTIRNFNTGTNSGLLSTPGTMTISGNGGSSFSNDALTLTQNKYHARTNTSIGASADSPPGLDTIFNPFTGKNGWVFANGDGDPTIDPLGTTTIFTNGAGIRAGNLVIQNVGSLSNLGSPFGAAVDSQSASGDSRGSLTSAATAGNGTSASRASLGTSGATTGSVVDASTAGSGTAASASSNSASGATAITAAGLVSTDASTAAGGTTFGPVTGADAISAASGAGFANGSTLGEAGTTTFISGKTAGGVTSATRFALVSAVAAFTSPVGKVLVGSLQLSLPTNPNGFFVSSRDPRFKVTVNGDLGISTDAVGSDLLAKELGYDPDYIEKRLGDAAYETYLVRQQLADQLGTRLLAGQTSETEQMRSLMTAGADAARQLGLTWGAAPTSEQLAGLQDDIVWMVAQVVDGEQVLTPQVYLSAETRAKFNGSTATIAATGSATIDVGDLTNRGGVITAGDNLSVNASGDIRNLSGTISGSDVSVRAGGSITNETLTSEQGDPNRRHDIIRTTIGQTATIAATGDLNLDAGQDLVVKGGDITAGGDGAIRAGRDIVVETITNTTADTTRTASSGTFGGTYTSTTVTTVENIASNINIGGNASVTSGRDATISGSNVNVGGDLAANVGGDLTVRDVQDTRTVDTVTSSSGMGVGGGIYGTQTTTSKDFTGTSVGSSIRVGGNAAVNAAGDVTLQGSTLAVDGDAAVNATNINVVEGRDVHTNYTKTETTTFGVFTDSGRSAGAGTTLGRGAVGASAGAQGSGEVTIGMRSRTEVSQEFQSTSRGSGVQVGGNASLNARENIVVRGSDVSAGGDLDVTAKNITTAAAQDIDSRNYDSTTSTTGLSMGGSGSATANAGGKYSPLGAAAGGSAQASGEASIGFKREVVQESGSSTTSTARVSTLTVGGNLNRTAENRIADVGTSIDVGGDLTQSAREIESLAAANTTSSDFTTSTETTRVGLYAEAGAKAEASGHTGGGRKSGAEAGASVGIKASYSSSTESGTERSSEAVVSTIRTGGNLRSTSSGKTTLEGTGIEVGGNADLSADSLDFKAARNTTDSTSNSSSFTAEAKVGRGVSTGGGGAAVSASVEYGQASESGSSSEAVTGSLATGGNLNIRTRGDARFEGTTIEGGGDTTIDAGGNVTFDAARNTSSAQSSEINASAGFSSEKGGDEKSSNFEASAGYGRSSESSSEAVTGSVAAGNNLTIRSGGKATFEGTDLAAGGNATVTATGDVEFKQATSTSSAEGFSISGGIEASNSSGKNDDGEATSERERGGEFGLGVSSANQVTAKGSNVAVGGRLAIASGNDVTLQGTQVAAGGDVDVNAAGNLNVTALQESNASAGFDINVSGASGKETEGDETTRSKQGAVALSVGFAHGSAETGATISSGGAINLTSGRDTSLVGTQIAAEGDVNVTASGEVNQRTAQSSSAGASISFQMSGKTETKTGGGDKDGPAEAPKAPAAPTTDKEGNPLGRGADKPDTGDDAKKAPPAPTTDKDGNPLGAAKAGTEKEEGEEEAKSRVTLPGVTEASAEGGSSKQEVKIKSTGGRVNVRSGTPPPSKSGQ